jgi:hypothetical protein
VEREGEKEIIVLFGKRTVDRIYVFFPYGIERRHGAVDRAPSEISFHRGDQLVTASLSLKLPISEKK